VKILPFLAFLVFPVSLCVAAPAGYLFVTFKGEQTPLTEQIYFALSKDGRRWEALNGGDPVLVSKLGEKGVRDPFIFRSHDNTKFYLIATDLSINLTRNWGRAQTAASKSILIWESTDLVKWSPPRLVRIAAPDAGCTWAPEAVYDETKKEYLVFWASKNRSDKFAKQRIWAARTKDFRTFSKPEIYIDRANDVIDTTIVFENGKYYRFSKDERTKAITLEMGDSLEGPWTEVPNFSLAMLQGFEGPTCYKLEAGVDGKPGKWCLMLDNYARGEGYKAWVTDDLASGQFTAVQDEMSFPFLFRHGSVLPLTQGQYDRVEAAFAKKK
jgi:hypothetical protein